LKDYVTLFLRQALWLPSIWWKPQVFSLSQWFFYKKTKISRQKLGAIREIRWLEEGSRGVLTSILSIWELWMRQRDAFS
jgi:hypothetical protein